MGQRHDAHREAVRVTPFRDAQREYDLRHSPPSDLLSTDANGLPYRFEDRNNVIHAVEGSRLVPDETNSFFLWTRCGQEDVAASDVYASREDVSCPHCAEVERLSDRADQSTTVARLMRADLAVARGRDRIARAEKRGEDANRAQDDTRAYLGIVRSMERELQRDRSQ